MLSLSQRFVQRSRALFADTANEPTQIPVLGEIPWLANHVYAAHYPPDVSDSAGMEPELAGVDVAYRQLAATLVRRKAWMSSGSRLVLTSLDDGPTPSWMAMRLACYLSRTGQRVLLVEGDFQNPTVHQAFDIPLDFSVGLMGVLEHCRQGLEREREFSGEESLGRRMGYCLEQTLPVAGLPLLRVLPLAGPERLLRPFTATEVDACLHHPSTALFFQGLQGYFDWILIDTAPFVQQAEPLILALQSDGMLLMAGWRMEAERLQALQAMAAVNQLSIWGMVVHAPL
jgi:Mrp family chromosome partitioning ATPase